jgi:hypothetical protein
VRVPCSDPRCSTWGQQYLSRISKWRDFVRDHATVSDSGGGHRTYFAFDLLHLDGEDVARLPLAERKARLAALLKKQPAGIAYSDHEGGDGKAFRRAACKHGLEGSSRSGSTALICPAIAALGLRASA